LIELIEEEGAGGDVVVVVFFLVCGETKMRDLFFLSFFLV